MFDDSLCGLKKLDKRELTYSLGKVTCPDCVEASRLEAIEVQRAMDTLPNCPHCGNRVEYVTLTFNVTKSFRIDIETERDYQSGKIKPLIYGSEYDTLDSELTYEKQWQVICTEGHEWFTKRLEPIEDGKQWFVKEDAFDSIESANLCPICGCDRTEHDWEVHITAEMRASQ
jgi:hypothetical protein